MPRAPPAAPGPLPPPQPSRAPSRHALRRGGLCSFHRERKADRNFRRRITDLVVARLVFETAAQLDRPRGQRLLRLRRVEHGEVLYQRERLAIGLDLLVEFLEV